MEDDQLLVERVALAFGALGFGSHVDLCVLADE